MRPVDICVVGHTEQSHHLEIEALRYKNSKEKAIVLTFKCKRNCKPNLFAFLIKTQL